MSAWTRPSSRFRLPVVDPVLGDIVFDGLAAGPLQGRVVLLLHGFPQSAEMWRGQLGALGAAGYRAVAIDQRGYSPDARTRSRACVRVGPPRRGHAVVRGPAGWRTRSRRRPRRPRLGRLRRLARCGTPSRAGSHAHGGVHAAPGRPVPGSHLGRRPGGALCLHPVVPPARQGRARAARRRRPAAAHDVRGLWHARLRRLRRPDDRTRGIDRGPQLVSRRQTGRHAGRGHGAHPVFVGRGRPRPGPGGGGGDSRPRSGPVPV